MNNKIIDLASCNNMVLEVLERKSNRVEIVVFNDSLEKYEISNIKKYSIKAIYNNKSIKLDCSNLKNPKNIINNIKKNINTLDNDEKDSFANENINDNKTKRLTIDYEKIKQELFDLYNLRKDYKSLKSITSYFNHSVTKTKIKNKDVTLKESNDIATIDIEISIEKNEKSDSSYASIPYKDFVNLKEIVINKIKELEDKIEYKLIESYKGNIILSNECVANILSAFGDMYSAKNIEKKNSVLIDKVGEKVFNEMVNIVEDPTKDYGYGKKLFDNDGVKTYYKEIIKNGVFIKPIYDKKTAIKNNIKPTGNGFGVKNLYLVPGKYSIENMFKKLDNGIYIDSIAGLHSGINHITGKISLQAQGYEVKNGKKTNGLKMIVFVTDIFELFNNILMIGNDFKIFDYTSGSPSILVQNINITGNK